MRGGCCLLIGALLGVGCCGIYGYSFVYSVDRFAVCLLGGKFVSFVLGLLGLY